MGNPTDIWMPLYIGDYLASTQQLSAEESGAYLHLLMHEWRVGPLPLDVEILRRIARVERDAWSNAWAMLEHFFTRTEAGFIQKRLEEEKFKSQQNQQRASNKGRAAAEKRWAKSDDATKTNADECSGNAQAMHKQYPSPSPSPSPSKKRQKTSRDKREVPRDTFRSTREVDPRHVEFRELAGEYWKYKNPQIAMPWDGSEAKQLSSLLAANPMLDVDAFRELLRTRAKSQVNHAERPRAWLAKVTDYSRGPLNEFNKPMGVTTNGKGKRTSNPSAERQQSTNDSILAAVANLTTQTGSSHGCDEGQLPLADDYNRNSDGVAGSVVGDGLGERIPEVRHRPEGVLEGRTVASAAC